MDYEKTGFIAPDRHAFTPSSFKGDTPERIDLVTGRFPRGKVVLLAGAGGVGKSFLLLQAFEAVNGGASHQTLGGQIVGKELPCFCLMGEDDRGSLDLRLRAIREHNPSVKPVDHGHIWPVPNIGHMPLVKKGWDGTIKPTEVLEWLERILTGALAEYGSLGFLVVDTFSTLLPVDANKPDEVQAAFSFLTSLAARLDLCVIVTHHMNKGAGADADRTKTAEELRSGIRGSTALEAAVRAAYVLHKLGSGDADRVRREAQMDDYTGDVIQLCLVKDNLGLRTDAVTYIRMPNGTLQDVSGLLGRRMSDEEALLQVVQGANDAGRKLTKTGTDGLFASRAASWPGNLSTMARAPLERLANQLIEDGRLIADAKGLTVPLCHRLPVPAVPVPAVPAHSQNFGNEKSLTIQ